MRIVFRVDASAQIGSGHVMRCMTLADKLTNQGHQIVFICRLLAGNYIDHIRQQGYDVFALPKPEKTTRVLDWNSHAAWLETDWSQDIDDTLDILGKMGDVSWLVVDHYAIDYRWEEKCRLVVSSIMVFDDLVEYRHDCDMLLNQNFYTDLKGFYAKLVPRGCLILQGVEYALLRPEFVQARKSLRERNGQVKEILVFLGGSDKENVTLKVVKAILLLERADINVNVVLGLANPHRLQIENFCKKHDLLNCIVQTNKIADLMASADLCVGAGGATSWERYCLSLPTLLVTMAHNQMAGAEFQARRGLVRLMGKGDCLCERDILKHLQVAIASPDELMNMSKKTMTIVDGQGCARVVSEMITWA